MVKLSIPLAQAASLAAEVVALLRPACQRIEVAGSIRRRRPLVGDIEIVCQPRCEARAGGLFAELTESVNLLDERVAALLRDGALRRGLDASGRPAWGSRYHRILYDGVQVDLFAVLAPAQWGVIYLLRTGPAAFNKRLVTVRHKGGWLPEWLKMRAGVLWLGDDLVSTPEEEDVFYTLGQPYVEPWVR